MMCGDIIHMKQQELDVVVCLRGVLCVHACAGIKTGMEHCKVPNVSHETSDLNVVLNVSTMFTVLSEY